MDRIDQAAAASARAMPRLKLFQPAEMSDAEGTRRVHLLDLSRAGARVYADGAIPPVGAAIALACGVDLGGATVAWVDGRRFGVCFAVALSERQLERVIAGQQAMIDDGRRRLGRDSRIELRVGI